MCLIHFYIKTIQVQSLSSKAYQNIQYCLLDSKLGLTKFSLPCLLEVFNSLILFRNARCMYDSNQCFIPNIHATNKQKHRPLNCRYTKDKISFLGPLLFVSSFLTSLTLKIYAATNIYFKSSSGNNGLLCI